MTFSFPKTDPNDIRRNRYKKKSIYPRLPSYLLKIFNHYRIQPQKVELWQKGGVSNYVFKVSLTANKVYALKISPKNDLERESDFYQKLNRHALPAPKIVFKDLGPSLLPNQFLITTWITGMSIYELNKTDRLQASMLAGRIIAKLNQILVKPQWQKLWPQRLEKDFLYNHVTRKVYKTILGVDTYHKIGKILADKSMRINSLRLLHADAGEDQFLFKKSRSGAIKLVAILDPGYLSAGDPMFELAYAMISWNLPEFNEGFLKGYQTVTRLTESFNYRFLRFRFLCQCFAAAFIFSHQNGKGKQLLRDALILSKQINYEKR